MRTEIFTFPSRMQVEMKGRPLASMRKTLESMRSGITKAITDSLKDATVSLIDPGDYDPDKIASVTGGVNWMNAIAEDRVFGLIATRIVSYTNGYNFDMEFGCLRCDATVGWRQDIRPVPDGELVVYHMPEESAKLFKEGTPFEFDFMGKKIKWRMITGQDEAVIEKLGRQDPDTDTNILTNAMRLVEVEGVDKGDKVKWLSSLGEELLELQGMMEDQACGLDTVMDVSCKSCHGRFEHPLPFDSDFWVPLQKARARRRKRSARARELARGLVR